MNNERFKLYQDLCIRAVTVLLDQYVDSQYNHKDVNTLLSFPNQTKPLALKNDLRITLDSKPEIFKNIEARKKLGVLIKKVCTYPAPRK